MPTLSPDECRVLGVLVEKAQTTPQQYPLTLNALVAGCNQKNNRDPVTNLDEDAVLAALDALRAGQLAREVMMTGSRVAKFRHVARETLAVSTSELVILAELLLRGPQTVGELRGRASRMHPLENVETVQGVLQGLMTRQPPLVRELPPAPGTRAARFAQLLCPELHPLDVVAPDAARAAVPAAGLAARVEVLEAEVAALKDSLRRLTEAVGAAG